MRVPRATTEAKRHGPVTDSDPVLSEDAARKLWQRAAELQAEAAHQLEARSRALVSTESEAEGGYRLAHVRQAAAEAGISEEFVEAALAEAVTFGRPVTASDRWADRLLGRGPRSLVATRTFPHPAEKVYESLQRVLPRYRLSLVDSRGSGPLEGGVLVFDLPSVSGIETTDPILRDMRLWADLREVHLQIRPLAPDRCEVTVRSPTVHARKTNLAVGAVLTAIGGGVGVLAAATIGIQLVGLLALGPLGELMAVMLMVALGFALGAGTFALPLKVLYRWGQGRGEAALERLLQAVGVDLRTGGVFQSPAHPPALPPTQPPT